MEFRILGPLEIRDGDRSPSPRGDHQRRLLAVLLHETGVPVPVPVDRLVAALWDGTPPETAQQQIQNVVSGLRGVLGNSRDRLRTSGRGYLLDVAEDELDLLRYRRHAAEARRARDRGDRPAALRALRAALAQWRGPALAGLGGRFVEGLSRRLDEERLSLLEQRFHLEVELGHHESAATELRLLVAEHPLRQPFTAQLMLALHRTGRSPEALAVYAQIASRLAEDLGADPGPALLNLHTAILRDDPDLKPARTDRVGHLPPPVAAFTGRDAALAALDAEAGSAVTVVTGAAGIGKTTLALHWARRAAERFPSGAMHLDLQGFGPNENALEPAEATNRLLALLGVDLAGEPSAPEARTALYREALARTPRLLILDNARDAAQVRPLLPGPGGGRTLVASRNDLVGLAVSHEVRFLPLEPFTRAESRALLERRLGAARTAAEPEAMPRLLAACAGLPLALAVTAARAAARPALTLDALAAELESSRLDALTVFDPETDLRAVLSWSYRALRPDAAQLFRRLGAHPEPHWTAPGAASLAAIPIEQTRALLRELASMHLVCEDRPGRYCVPDLLHEYAAELAELHDRDRSDSESVTHICGPSPRPATYRAA